MPKVKGARDAGAMVVILRIDARAWAESSSCNMITLQTARRYEDLLGETVAVSPYEYATLFEAKGWFARQRAKARFKLLKAIDPKLARVLHAGERVYYVSKGSLASTGEQFFAGQAVAYYVNLRALIFTTERVILMQIGSNLKPRQIVSELPYTAIRQVKATWTGFCEVVLSNGKKHRFSGMPSAERKFLRDFLEGVVSTPAPTTALAKKSDGLVHLCPHCFTGVPGWPLSCDSCGGGFKSARTAALLSLLFPGLGDWYLGHRRLAVIEMIGTAFLWLIFIIAPALAAAAGEAPEEIDAGFTAFSAVIVAGAHLIDAAVTHSFARKGHHPGKAPTAAPATAIAPTAAAAAPGLTAR